MTASSHTGPGRETRRRAAVPEGDGVGVEAARRGAEAAVYCVSRVRRGVLLCCDVTSTIRRLYDPHSKVYDALRAENSRKMIERWKDDKFRAKVIKGMVRAWKLHYLISRHSRAHVTRQRLHLSRAHLAVFACLEHISTPPLV